MNKRFRPTLLSLACAPLLFASYTASSAVLEEVMVTAQKREQSLQDVGIAVTAFSGDQLSQLGWDSAEKVTSMTPGVTTIQPNGPSSFFINIRGVAQNDFSGDHQESPVAIYVDDVYISAASGAGFQLFDFDRVEVLRGPQGTLFGRNATGGLVHYLTTKPSEESNGYIDLTLGDYSQVKLEGAAGGSLSDNVSGRLSFVKNEHDGVLENSAGDDLNDGDDWAVRGQLLFSIGDNIEWLFNARAGEQDVKNGPFKHSSARLNPVTGLGEDFNGLDLTAEGDSRNEVGYRDLSSDVNKGAINVAGFNTVETTGFTSNLTWQIGELEFVSITDYSDLEKEYLEDSDAGPNDFFAFQLNTDMDQFSQEFRLSGATDSMRWVAGAFYLNIDGDFSNGGAASNFFAAAFPGFGLDDPSIDGLGLISPFTTETESYAVFGQLEFDLSDTVTLTTGLRWSNEQKEVDFKQYAAIFESPDSANVAVEDAFGVGPLWAFGPDGVNNDGAVLSGFAIDPVIGDPGDAEIDVDSVTAKLGLDWHANEDTLIYVSFNRGVKAGGFNAPIDATNFYDGSLDPSQMQFDEEVLDAYETGFKWTFADGLARLNGSVYYYDYQDYQAFALDSLTTFVFNTDATSKGMELELQASPTEGLDILFGVGYIDNNVEDAYRRPDGSFVDRDAVVTPDLNVNGMIRYEWGVGSGMLAAQYDFTYLGDHFFQLKNSPVAEEDGYAISNVRLTYTGGDDKWSVTGFVNNVTDEENRLMVFDLAGTPAQGGFGLAENFYGPPRWWGVSFNYRWGS
jgi:iron complex outermembrane receptor protein